MTSEITDPRLPDESRQRRLAELRREIAVGSAEADRGELDDGAEVFSAIRRRSADQRRVEGRLHRPER